jgi:hypothetical protein
MSNQKLIFTITAGRTGTAWLSKFIAINSQFESVHEPVRIEDFGTMMPDIKIMRTFNDIGMTDSVKDFWQRKFEILSNVSHYSEVNHTLSKCGLIEFMGQYTDLKKNVSIILLRRKNRVKHAVSFLVRNDFSHITLQWQWYLSFRYKRKLIQANPFAAHGNLGLIFWYIYEMEARQEYYKKLYGDRFNFIDFSLEEIVTESGSKNLASSLCINQDLVLPPPNNANKQKPSSEMIELASNFDSICQIDPKEIAEKFINSGERLAFIK